MNKTISIITLGCKVNQYESLSLACKLSQLGYTVLIGIKKADIYIINSCAVTNEAEKKSRGIVAKLIKQNPNAKIYVCGCASQFCPSKFEQYSNVISICGTANKMKIIDEITKTEVAKINIDKICSLYEDKYFAPEQKIRSIIKIQDGCNNFCSYCIIPYLRGRERSRSLVEIEKEFVIQSNTTLEIILAGINTSAWGSDFVPKLSLVDLVKALSKYSVRFRFGSLEANIIDDNLLSAIKNAPNFCDHFHLSLQSGSNSVLFDMNRKYTIGEYISKVNLIRKYFPNAGITTDLIVGFPTESDECFEETIANLEKINFSNIHIFPYSRRDGTAASKLKDLNPKITKNRADILSGLKQKYITDFLTKQIGIVQEILIEEKVDDYFIGYSKNYTKCKLKSIKDLTSKIVLAIGKSVDEGTLLCEEIK